MKKLAQQEAYSTSDIHIDSSIIDKVRKDTDKEIAEIENDSKKRVEKKQAEEESSDEEEEMTEQEKLYGESQYDEKKKKHHKQVEEPKPEPV